MPREIREMLRLLDETDQERLMGAWNQLDGEDFQVWLEESGLGL
jgi:hypothetical protein